jgi:putative hydrolase of the HAD superfamily
MFPFDAILFDVGGVLLTNGWDHVERAIVLQQFHLDRTEFEARHPQPYDAWERDAITAKEYLDATVFYQPRAFSHEEFLDAICAQSKLLPDGGMGILQELAASDKCILGVLNNEARATNEYRFKTFGIRQHVKLAFSSCYLGHATWIDWPGQDGRQHGGTAAPGRPSGGGFRLQRGSSAKLTAQETWACLRSKTWRRS